MQRRLVRASESPALQKGGDASDRRPAEAGFGAEVSYYLVRMRARSLVTITLSDRSTIRGRIEWYDRAALSVVREDGVHLLLYKHQIAWLS